jgi:hypothetical protein
MKLRALLFFNPRMKRRIYETVQLSFVSGRRFFMVWDGFVA